MCKEGAIMKYEKSCGIVVFNNNKVLLVHHNLGHWGFPKGHVELGETDEETAQREVFEETGISASIIEGFKEKITYRPKEGIEKDVYFFVGVPTDNNLVPQLSEVSEAKFIDVDDSYNTITHIDEKNILEKAIIFYKNLKKN